MQLGDYQTTTPRILLATAWFAVVAALAPVAVAAELPQAIILGHAVFLAFCGGLGTLFDRFTAALASGVALIVLGWSLLFVLFLVAEATGNGPY